MFNKHCGGGGGGQTNHRQAGVGLDEFEPIHKINGIGGQLHSNTLHGSLGGVDFAKLPLAAQQVVPCGNVVGRSLAELIVPQSP